MTTIGFFSPSTPITAISPKRFARAKVFLRQQGIDLIAGNLTGQQDGYRSGSIAARTAELNALIHNPQVDVLMATIGGLNSNALLGGIDYAALRAHPKTIVGYSDVTALLLAIKTQAPACRVLYGPALVASFGEWSPLVDPTWAALKAVFETPNGGSVTLQAPATWTDARLNWEEFEHAKPLQQNQWVATGPTQLSGRVLGGNLDTFAGFLRSPYFPELHADTLLFIEDAEKTAAEVERNFAMLANAGCFDQVGGIILGKHALFDDAGTGRTPLTILQEVLGHRDLPIIADYDGGHTVPMLTTPIGAQATFDADARTVTFSAF